MLQRFSITLALVQAGNTSEKLLNKICHLSRAKEIITKVYKNIINSIKI